MRRDTVFSQILQLICRYRFKKCVDQYDGDRYTKRLSCWQHLLVLLFSQTKCLHSLHELTRIVGELLLDNVYLIEILTIPFNRFRAVKQKQGQLALPLRF